MKKHVTNLELSKKLKALGVRQESIFEWRAAHALEPSIHLVNPDDSLISTCSTYSAFLASEIGEMLPEGCVAWKTSEGHYLPKKYDLINGEVKGAFTSSMKTKDWSMVNTYACMLIHLIENKIITL